MRAAGVAVRDGGGMAAWLRLSAADPADREREWSADRLPGAAQRDL